MRQCAGVSRGAGHLEDDFRRRRRVPGLCFENDRPFRHAHFRARNAKDVSTDPQRLVPLYPAGRLRPGRPMDAGAAGQVHAKDAAADGLQVSVALTDFRVVEWEVVPDVPPDKEIGTGHATTLGRRRGVSLDGDFERLHSAVLEKEFHAADSNCLPAGSGWAFGFFLSIKRVRRRTANQSSILPERRPRKAPAVRISPATGPKPSSRARAIRRIGSGPGGFEAGNWRPPAGPQDGAGPESGAGRKWPSPAPELPRYGSGDQVGASGVRRGRPGGRPGRRGRRSQRLPARPWRRPPMPRRRRRCSLRKWMRLRRTAPASRPHAGPAGPAPVEAARPSVPRPDAPRPRSGRAPPVRPGAARSGDSWRRRKGGACAAGLVA